GASPVARCVAVRQSPLTETLPNASVHSGPENRRTRNATSNHVVRKPSIAVAILMDCADAATKVGAGFAFFFGLVRHRITELSSIRSRHPAKAFTPGYAVFVGRQVERL